MKIALQFAMPSELHALPGAREVMLCFFCYCLRRSHI